MNNPIFVALDVDNDNQALELARNVKPYVGGFKVGPRLIVKYGAQIISDLAKFGHVFVDNKYYDIPNTMESAIRASFEAGASFATIHAACGKEALQRLAKVESELNIERPFKILAVTVLTSFSENLLPPHWKPQKISQHVMDLAKLVHDCGLGGLVCSPLESSAIHNEFRDMFLVTPGIRLSDVKADDQKRVCTPVQALSNGASAIVVGRPIVAASDPKVAAKTFYENLTNG